VEDIEAARRRLEQREVRFDGPTRTIEGLVKLATFYDPDGNTFMLYEDLQKGQQVPVSSEAAARG
jgi:CreA protein